MIKRSRGDPAAVFGAIVGGAAAACASTSVALVIVTAFPTREDLVGSAMSFLFFLFIFSFILSLSFAVTI